MSDELIKFFQRIVANKDFHDAHGGRPTSGVHTYVSVKTLIEMRKLINEVSECRCVRADGETRFNINCAIHGKAP